MQRPCSQSPSTAQPEHGGHGEHDPPQSTSVSSPSCRPFEQLTSGIVVEPVSEVSVAPTDELVSSELESWELESGPVAEPVMSSLEVVDITDPDVVDGSTPEVPPGASFTQLPASPPPAWSTKRRPEVQASSSNAQNPGGSHAPPGPAPRQSASSEHAKPMLDVQAPKMAPTPAATNTSQGGDAYRRTDHPCYLMRCRSRPAEECLSSYLLLHRGVAGYGLSPVGATLQTQRAGRILILPARSTFVDAPRRAQAPQEPSPASASSPSPSPSAAPSSSAGSSAVGASASAAEASPPQ